MRECVKDETKPINFVTHSQVGIVTGNRTINPLPSLLVSIESAKLEGMTDFCVISASHPFIMNDKLAIAQTLAFLACGEFTCRDRQTVAASD